MTRLRIVLVLLVGVVALAGWGAYWALGTCRPLDRLLGLSGCVASVAVDGFNPLNRVAMSTPDEEGVSSLFGWARTVDGWRPAMMRLSPSTGAEYGRHPLRIGNDFGIVRVSADGAQALVSCHLTSACVEDGGAGAIVALTDAAEIETLAEMERYPRAFPGEPEAGPDFRFDSYLAEGGAVVAAERDRSISLYEPDGTLRAVLIEASSRRGDNVARMTVSPSGRYLALLDRAYSREQPSAFHVWELRGGAEIARIGLDSGYAPLADPVWSADERHLFAVRRQGATTLVDTFALGMPDD